MSGRNILLLSNLWHFRHAGYPTMCLKCEMRNATQAGNSCDIRSTDDEYDVAQFAWD
jgi:hypothetical protein